MGLSQALISVIPGFPRGYSLAQRASFSLGKRAASAQRALSFSLGKRAASAHSLLSPLGSGQPLRIHASLCVYRGVYGGYPPCVCTGCIWWVYTLLVYTPLYHPGYTHHPTMLPSSSLLAGCTSRSERPWGSMRENHLGGERGEGLMLVILLWLVGPSAQSYSALPRE